MPRPRQKPVDRLRHKLWAHMLMQAYAASLKGKPGIRKQGLPTWADLGRSLLDTNKATRKILPAGRRFQGLTGVVNRGNDPRRVMLRVDVAELPMRPPNGIHQGIRTPSGRKLDGESKAKTRYAEFELNLVELGNTQLPASGLWDDALFWDLCGPHTMGVEEVRYAILKMAQALDLVAPSIIEYRPFVSKRRHRSMTAMSRVRQARVYAHSLRQISANPSAVGMSLLAALVTDSHATGDDELFQVHHEAFRHAAESMYLKYEIPKKLQMAFEKLVVEPMWKMTWRARPIYHVPSIDRPYLTMEEWSRLTGSKWEYLEIG